MQYILGGRHRHASGFTLVELLAIIPIMILIISGVVVAAVNLSGASLRASARTELQSEVLDALDQIEQDVKLSVDFEGTSTDRISVHNLATSTNPLSADRKLIKNSTCTVAPTGLSASDALAYRSVAVR